MEIINQHTFFIKYHFTTVFKDLTSLTKSQQSRANKGLREFFQRLSGSNLDIGNTEQRFFYLIAYHKTIQEFESPYKDWAQYGKRKRKQTMQRMDGLLFEISWMGSILDIDKATVRITNIAENMRKRYNIPKVEVFLGAETRYYKTK